MMHDMERAGIEIVHMLTESRPISGIISFQQPDEAAREIESTPGPLTTNQFCGRTLDGVEALNIDDET